jgi:hypothetical protein
LPSGGLCFPQKDKKSLLFHCHTGGLIAMQPPLQMLLYTIPNIAKKVAFKKQMVVIFLLLIAVLTNYFPKASM